MEALSGESESSKNSLHFDKDVWGGAGGQQTSHQRFAELLALTEPTESDKNFTTYSMHIGDGAGDGNDEPGQADEHEQDASTSEISSEQPDNDTHSVSSDSHSDEYEAGLENLDPDQPVQSTESGENTTDQPEAQDDRARFERTLMEAEIARLEANMSRRRQIESDLAGSTDSDSESPADDLETIDDNENTISPSPHSSDGEDLDEENLPASVASRRHVRFRSRSKPEESARSI